MGLDMYVYLEDKETKEITEFSYYRKFNALQGYFVREYDLENCGKVLLTKDRINSIYSLLNKVHYDQEKASLLLPTFPGPFFGSYEYDRMYFEYVRQAAADFYHAKFIDFNKYDLYFTSDW